MKVDKKLKKVIDQLVKMSFDSKGSLEEKKSLGFVKILKDLKGSQGILALSHYLKGIKREMNKTTLEIVSPLPLTQPQVKKIMDNMRKDYLVSDVKTTINEALFGGIRVKIGDVVYDDSVSQRISQLKGAING